MVQDTIPVPPGGIFTDLTYNSSTNTLWLANDNFGIWKYDIPADNAIKNTVRLEKSGTSGKIVQKNNGLLLYSIPCADEINVTMYTISGRAVYANSFTSGHTGNSVYVELNRLPQGHYVGEIRYRHEGKYTANVLNINIIK